MVFLEMVRGGQQLPLGDEIGKSSQRLVRMTLVFITVDGSLQMFLDFFFLMEAALASFLRGCQVLWTWHLPVQYTHFTCASCCPGKVGMWDGGVVFPTASPTAS